MALGWGAKTASTQLVTVSTEQFFSQTPKMEPNELAHVQLISDASGTTDDLIVAVYSTLDDASFVWDEEPVFEIRVDNNAGLPNEISFVVQDLYRFRVGVRRSGTTDTFTVDMNHRIATRS